MDNDKNNYALAIFDIIRKFGILIPFIVIVYGLLAQFGYISSDNFNGLSTFMMIVSGWFMLGIFQLIFKKRTSLLSLIRFGAYHILIGMSYLFISSTVLILWPILMVSTYVFYGRKGLKINIFILSIIIAIGFCFNTNNLAQIFVSIIFFISLNLTGIAVIIISKSHEIKQDLIHKSRLKESVQRNRAATIVNNLTDSVIGTDMKGIVRVHNASTLSLLDTNISINGQGVNKALHLVDKDGIKIDIASIIRASKITESRDDLYLEEKGSKKIRLSAIFTPIRRGYSEHKKSEILDGHIIILRDITKEKELEEERDEFISVASHELRTPITIAEGIISNVLLMIKLPNICMSVLKKLIGDAHDQVVFLSSMINDLATLSRAEHKSTDDETDIDVHDLASELLNKYIGEATAKKLKIDIDVSPNVGKVHTNRLYIEELLQNFMTNAIKYTKDGSISIVFKRYKNYIKFSIKDTGIGISKSDQINLFNKFFRAEDLRARESSGTGLGLYVAAKLAQKINTRISLESRINFGSIFSFSLPVVKNAQKEEDIS